MNNQYLKLTDGKPVTASTKENGDTAASEQGGKGPENKLLKVQADLNKRLREIEGRTIGEEGDRTEQDFLSLQLESDEVREIKDALRRISDGTYGKCEWCLHGIPKGRREAKPAARYCVPCQTAVDKGAVPPHSDATFEKVVDDGENERTQKDILEEIEANRRLT